LGKFEYYPIWENSIVDKFVNAQIFGHKSGLSNDSKKKYIFDEFVIRVLYGFRGIQAIISEDICEISFLCPAIIACIPR
jgi:hypothetical protein